MDVFLDVGPGEQQIHLICEFYLSPMQNQTVIPTKKERRLAEQHWY